MRHEQAAYGCLDELEAVASAISIAPRTALFGVGSSGLVASDLSEKLASWVLPLKEIPKATQGRLHNAA
jgi:DNA-binding MurR/RpiR family transcriptional regulator